MKYTLNSSEVIQAIAEYVATKQGVLKGRANVKLICNQDTREFSAVVELKKK